MKESTQRRKKRSSLTPRQREIWGILLITFGILALVSLHTQTAGILGESIRSGLRFMFGQVAEIFIGLLFWFSIQIIRGTKRKGTFRKILGFCLVLFSFITFFHTVVIYRGYQLPPSLTEEIKEASSGSGSGVLGAILMTAVLTAFGFPSSYIVLISVFLIGLILYIDISLIELIKYSWAQVINYFQTKRDSFLRKRVKARVQNEPKIEHKEDVVVAKSSAVKKKNGSTKADVFEIVEEKDAGEYKVEVKPIEIPQASSTGRLEKPPTFLLKRSNPKALQPRGDSQKELLEQTLASHKISAKVVNISRGPVVTRYELQPAAGVKVSRITALADDISLALSSAGVRIEAPVPGKPVVGIEVPNKETAEVLLRDVLETPQFADHSSKVVLALGKDISGNPVVADLKKWLHVLVAGATGSGKSVCLNAMIASILFKANPDEVKLLMVDPKRVELSVYNGIPHLITPVVTDPKQAANALNWAVNEMERRYKIFEETSVRNIDMYSELPPAEDGEERENLPYIVIIIDELADLMMVAAAEVEDAICRIAQKARAAGIYLVIATQRPSVDVITGLIKANIPSRISFAVSSQVDSRTILDMAGAERLIGKGDMLYYPIGASKPMRAQGAWISDKEVEALVSYWKKQAEPEYEETVTEEQPKFIANYEEDDELLPDSIRLVVEQGQASISMLQRRFRIGYSRAARLIDMMEVRGIVGSYQGSKPREVLVDESFLEEQ